MRKFKLFIDYDKEEKWLNDMAKKGYRLEKAYFGYRFNLADPEDTTIRIDCREFKNKNDFVDYCTLFEDSGWKHICGNKNSGAQYFKKNDPNAFEDIFSDRASKSERYKRLSNQWMKIALMCLSILIVFNVTGLMDYRAIFNPKSLYLTPGLWNMDAAKFWNAFWFETPFAIFRGVLLITPPIFIVLYIIFSYKADKLFRKESNNETD